MVQAGQICSMQQHLVWVLTQATTIIGNHNALGNITLPNSDHLAF